MNGPFPLQSAGFRADSLAYPDECLPSFRRTILQVADVVEGKVPEALAVPGEGRSAPPQRGRSRTPAQAPRFDAPLCLLLAHNLRELASLAALGEHGDSLLRDLFRANQLGERLLALRRLVLELVRDDQEGQCLVDVFGFQGGVELLQHLDRRLFRRLGLEQEWDRHVRLFGTRG